MQHGYEGLPGTHVAVPLAWLNEILEVYYAAKSERLVPKDHLEEQVQNLKAHLEAEAREEHPDQLLPARTQLVGAFGNPGPGYTPMGVAAQPVAAQPGDVPDQAQVTTHAERHIPPDQEQAGPGQGPRSAPGT